MAFAAFGAEADIGCLNFSRRKERYIIMKKLISYILCTVLLLSALLSLSSCMKDPLESFFDDVNKKQNFQLDITMKDVPIFGTITMTSKKDGNKTFTSGILGASDTYSEEADGVLYSYVQDEDGNWTKTEAAADEEVGLLDGGMPEFLVSDNFEKTEEEGVYKLKEEAEIEDAEDVVLKLSDGKCTVEFSVKSEGLVVNAEVCISEVGEIEITLPELAQ